ncbi:DUF5680 domain-containing protein [Rummeliibacillus pycnus]|uniref:DUF5680 domain-containing protein n=1 Tax=Rummeliibacillus pycnus TaxID=101070 RepID=UPI001B808D9A|nr:DUF5680 domain-containing protein [Rummeliibacillus pycnus]
MKVYKDFLGFLINAKKATYASFDTNSIVKEPLLNRSKQLEYKEGEFLYRDIYFGVRYFVGQETVYYQDKPIWGMAYSGGLTNDTDLDTERFIYEFLREAMRNVSKENPFRGPNEFKKRNFIYNNSNQGNLENFKGKESIHLKNQEVYILNYTGGMIK